MPSYFWDVVYCWCVFLRGSGISFVPLIPLYKVPAHEVGVVGATISENKRQAGQLDARSIPKVTKVTGFYGLKAVIKRTSVWAGVRKLSLTSEEETEQFRECWYTQKHLKKESVALVEEQHASHCTSLTLLRHVQINQSISICSLNYKSLLQLVTSQIRLLGIQLQMNAFKKW